MVQALMLGTPVICSDRGACPEIVSPEVGFVCALPQDYVAAIARFSEISPAVLPRQSVKGLSLPTNGAELSERMGD